MKQQVSFLHKAFLARFTGEIPISIMQPRVPVEVHLFIKLPRTDVADMEFFAGVPSLVNSQACFRRPTFLAETTDKWPVASVEPLVKIEALSTSKGLRAELAGEGFLDGVQPLVNV